MKPEVSIIIPYYEGEKWLPISMNSVQKQVGVSWELIVVDDGSKKDPTFIVQSLQDKHIRLIRIPHAGKGVALNTGVAHSEADIVCFLDQDDIMNPGRLKLQYNAFVDHLQEDVVYSDYERVYDDGRIIDQFISRQADSRECLKCMARKRGLVSMQTIMMKKTTFNDIGGFSNDIQLTGLDDAEFFVRLFASGVVLKYVPGLVQKWVLHEQNYSVNADFQQARLTLLRHLSKHARNNPWVREELPYFQYHAFFMRGLFYLERGMAKEALLEYMKAVRVHPLNINGYYLLLKSWMKKWIY
jgi:glycosyltransferase involved in cell wall biosynthesis